MMNKDKSLSFSEGIPRKYSKMDIDAGNTQLGSCCHSAGDRESLGDASNSCSSCGFSDCKDTQSTSAATTTLGCNTGPLCSSSDPMNSWLAGDAFAALADICSVPSNDTKPRRPKRHKYALLVGYSGAGYLGMQIQGDLPTVELDLLKALRSLDLITEDDVRRPGHNFYFQRAARTDKGVSAVRQVCSMQLAIPDQDTAAVLAGLNNHLPSQIQIFGIQRVTKGFDAKRWCSARTYSYTIPSYAFAKIGESIGENFRLPEGRIDELNDVFKLYCGTHNFYNFTSNRAHTDRSCNRYIISCYCDQPKIFGGNEFVTIYLKGQSFLLNQIRKMVGVAVAIVRGAVDRSIIERAFRDPRRLDLPKAPGRGLLLEQVHYDWYNERYAKTHDPLTWTSAEPQLIDFRNNVLIQHIIDEENRDREMMNWLCTIQLHEYEARTDGLNVPVLKLLAVRALLRIGRTASEIDRIICESKSSTASNPCG